MDTIPPHATDHKFLIPKTTFIYALVDPETNEVRYVGKANDPQQRYRRHLRKSKDSYRMRWINDLKSRSLKPILQIIEEVPIELWEEREMYWIAFYRSQGCPLTNTSPGGNGGAYNTPEMSSKVSSKLKGRPSKSRGVKRPSFSPEWCANISAAKKGKKPSPESRVKAANTRRGKSPSPETCARISASSMGKKGVPHTAKWRESMARQRGKKMPPEAVAKSAAAKRDKPRSPATKAKLSLAAKKQHAMKKSSPSDAPTLWD